MAAMKWRNLDIGPGYYFITSTCSAWRPLLSRADLCVLVCKELITALDEVEGSLGAWVVMPDHLHLLVELPLDHTLASFLRTWRGRSARKALDLLQTNDAIELRCLTRTANGECRYAFWKEQARSLPIQGSRKLWQKVDYMHWNPVRRGLVEAPEEWDWSSHAFYTRGEQGLLPVTPPLV